MAGRPMKPIPDEADPAVAGFASALREMVADAVGEGPISALVRHGDVGRSTLMHALSGQRLPTFQTVRKIVNAVAQARDLDTGQRIVLHGEWIDRWNRAASASGHAHTQGEPKSPRRFVEGRRAANGDTGQNYSFQIVPMRVELATDAAFDEMYEMLAAHRPESSLDESVPGGPVDPALGMGGFVVSTAQRLMDAIEEGMPPAPREKAVAMLAAALQRVEDATKELTAATEDVTRATKLVKQATNRGASPESAVTQPDPDVTAARSTVHDDRADFSAAVADLAQTVVGQTRTGKTRLTLDRQPDFVARGRDGFLFIEVKESPERTEIKRLIESASPYLNAVLVTRMLGVGLDDAERCEDSTEDTTALAVPDTSGEAG
ncbi:hypothetical protein [Streptomyces sp. NPDC049040]|uniref:hypothetical protein n=1 Tax=Streptomyces sp. NPDC049040 TaxID=3365593 RepID=UPI003722B5DF